MHEWITNTQIAIFSRIKKEFSEKIKKKYKITNVNFSAVGINNTPAVFPFVYVQFLESNEIEEDLEWTFTSGFRCSIQIDITDNAKQSTANEIAFEARKIMKKMKFKCSVPFLDYSDKSVYRYIIRCSRVIDFNDVL